QRTDFRAELPSADSLDKTSMFDCSIGTLDSAGCRRRFLSPIAAWKCGTVGGDSHRRLPTAAFSTSYLGTRQWQQRNKLKRLSSHCYAGTGLKRRSALAERASVELVLRESKWWFLVTCHWSLA